MVCAYPTCSETRWPESNKGLCVQMMGCISVSRQRQAPAATATTLTSLWAVGGGCRRPSRPPAAWCAQAAQDGRGRSDSFAQMLHRGTWEWTHCKALQPLQHDWIPMHMWAHMVPSRLI